MACTSGFGRPALSALALVHRAADELVDAIALSLRQRCHPLRTAEPPVDLAQLPAVGVIADDAQSAAALEALDLLPDPRHRPEGKDPIDFHAPVEDASFMGHRDALVVHDAESSVYPVDAEDAIE